MINEQYMGVDLSTGRCTPLNRANLLWNIVINTNVTIIETNVTSEMTTEEPPSDVTTGAEPLEGTTEMAMEMTTEADNSKSNETFNAVTGNNQLQYFMRELRHCFFQLRSVYRR
jgi:hypothetical protein